MSGLLSEDVASIKAALAKFGSDLDIHDYRIATCPERMARLIDALENAGAPLEAARPDEHGVTNGS